MTHPRHRLILLLAAVVVAGCGRSTLVPLAASLSVRSSGELVGRRNDAQRGKPRRYVVGKVPVGEVLPVVPRVLLSKSHAKLCIVGVDQPFPAIELPRLGGKRASIKSLLGKRATVVLFWSPDRWMARAALHDLQRDIVSKMDPKQVSVVGIALGQSSRGVRKAIGRAQAKFPQLRDPKSTALAHVGTHALPRIYVLDSKGTIAWFDIEYSEGTRRELQQTLAALAADNYLATEQ